MADPNDLSAPKHAANNAASLAKPAEDPLKWLAHASHDPLAITQRMQYAAQYYHLISPATMCCRVPDGCDIVLSVETISEAETYKQQGKFALQKVALDKIASAAGLSWDTAQSHRLDDGSNPYYCEYVAIALIRDLDGAIRSYPGRKVMDLRPGSAQVERIIANTKPTNPGEDPRVTERKAQATIRDMRACIVEHAETKASLRAIRRACRIRTAYEPAELAKPFVVAKLMFHGDSADPVLRRENARAIRESFLGARGALYSADRPAPVRHIGSPPPPVRRAIDADGVVIDDDDDDHEDPPARHAHDSVEPAPSASPECATSHAAAVPTYSPPPPPPPPAHAQRAPAGDVMFRFGRMKDQPISSFGDQDLRWYIGAVNSGLDDPEKKQYRANGERQLAALLAEQSRRAGHAPGGDTRHQATPDTQDSPLVPRDGLLRSQATQTVNADGLPPDDRIPF